MRVTNKMMNNTSLNNINKNKEYLDKLNNQMASEKKITRPSDDPIIAIRALRLRSNLTEISQYYDKNLKDARAWLTATQDAIESTQSMVTSMRSLFTQGSNATNSSESRAAIIDTLKAYKSQIYDDGNADYAGRFLFTGYRTSTQLTFTKNDAEEMTSQGGYRGITEEFELSDVESITYISGKVDSADISTLSKLLSLPDADVPSTSAIAENSVSRIRLAYENIDKAGTVEVTIDGVKYTANSVPRSDSSYAPADGTVNFVPETGEIILASDIASTIKSDSKISVVYDKSKWAENDLRPENYFACETTAGIKYEKPAKGQVITYDISSNQKIEINTTCDELYDPSIGRDVDEILAALQDYDDALSKQKTLQGYYADYADVADDNANKVKVKQALDSATKEVDATKQKVQKMFEQYQSRFDGYIDEVKHSATENGSRLSRVELVDNRLLDLKTTAKELADENENVEVTDMAIELSEAKLVYEAALMATGKVSQVTLLNYI